MAKEELTEEEIKAGFWRSKKIMIEKYKKLQLKERNGERKR